MSVALQAQVKPNSTPSPSFMPVQRGLQRKCASNDCEERHKKKRFGMQTKLKVNVPGDIYEQEADQIANQVMATPAHPVIIDTPRIDRLIVQSTGQTDTAPASVDRVIANPGRPLEPALRKDLEQRFGHDFSRVRVHSGAPAEQSAREVNAHAYTVGYNMVFGAGQFAAETREGRRLIAHELTHVVQQESSSSISMDLLQRQASQAQQQTSFEGCDPALQKDLQSKHLPALEHVNHAVASLLPGWARMNPVDKSAFRRFFDPANSGDIDEGFVRNVRDNFQRIHSYMRSLRFDCDPSSRSLCGASSRWCVGGRLMWTCFGNLHVCTNAYPSASDDFKIETIIHESVHNALMTTDRAYTSSPEFSQLTPRGSGFWGSVLNFLGNIPVLGAPFRLLPGNKDTINNPDSYAKYAMEV